MTSETPEDQSSAQPTGFGSTPDTWSEPTPDAWAHEPGQPAHGDTAPISAPGQATEASEAGSTPTNPWPQQGPWPEQQGPWPQQGQPAPVSQADPGHPAPSQSPSGQIPPSPHQAGRYPSGLHPPGQYPAGPSSPGQYPPGQYPSGQPGQFPQSQYAPGPYPPGQYPAGQYPAGQYPAGQYPAGQYLPGQYPPGHYPPGQFGYPPQFYAPVRARNNPFAITALVCGIVQFPLLLTVVGNILCAIPAIVFGSIALKQIRVRGEQGRGMATAGIVLGAVGILIFALIIVGIVIGANASSSS